MAGGQHNWREEAIMMRLLQLLFLIMMMMLIVSTEPGIKVSKFTLPLFLRRRLYIGT